MSGIDDTIALVRSYDGKIFEHADKLGVDPLCLRSQILLHLPGISDHWLPGAIDKIGVLLEEKFKPHKDLMERPEVTPELYELEFRPLEEETAMIYHEVMHYVGSYRPGQHYAMTYKGKIICMGSVADFDLWHLRDKIPEEIDSASIKILSRFFSHRGAPKNLFSYFGGKLREWLIKYYNTKLMFSFINPNLGFTAGSHLGARWQMFAYEDGAQYYYDQDGHYRTLRYVLAHPEQHFYTSTMELHPLIILANALQPEAQKAIPETPYLITRPVRR